MSQIPPPIPPRSASHNIDELDYIDPTESRNYLEQEKQSNMSFFTKETSSVGSYLFGKRLDTESFGNELHENIEQTAIQPEELPMGRPSIGTKIRLAEEADEIILQELCDVEVNWVHLGWLWDVVKSWQGNYSK